MLPKEIMSAIKKIESYENVSFNFLGVDIWPVVRNAMMTSSTHVKRSLPHTRPKKSAIILSAIKFLFSFRKVDGLVLTSRKFSEVVSGERFYKEAQVIAEQAAKENKKISLLFQDQSLSEGLSSYSFESVYFYCGVFYTLARILAFMDRFSRIHSYAKKSVLLFSQEIGVDIALRGEVQGVVRNIYTVVLLAAFFKFYIRRVKPEKCYVICYYSCVGMAFSAACNQLGISVIDVQHGMSGRNMRAYGGWDNKYSVVYNTLPSLFLCWTEFDKRAIDEWLHISGEIDRQAVVSGNLWRNYLLDKHIEDFQGLTLPAILSSRDSKVFVLITLNSLVLPETLLEVIKKSTENVYFLIRAHPDSRQLVDLVALENSMKLVNENVNVVDASWAPIHGLMRQVDIHLTEWSASVYDAYFEGVRSIVISPVGRDYFEDFIISGAVDYISSVGEIVDSIQSLKK